MEDKHLAVKHRFAFGATISAFFCFTLLVFGPMIQYVTGSDEMWFSFRSLLSPVILVSVVSFAILTPALSLPPRTIHKVLCCLIFGISLGLYLQCAFLNIDYGSGVLDGSQIAWKDYTTYGAIDSAIWAACIALPFALYMVFKHSWRHILMVTAMFLVFLQIGSLAIRIYQNKNMLDKLGHEVSLKGIYELSSDDNTIVFILGSMDQSYYEDYKKAHPEITEELEGFTEYDNALAGGSDSLVSIPAMLTGDIYKKDIKFTDFISNSWTSTNVFDVLKKHNVDTRIFTEEKYFGNAAVKKVENIVNQAQDSKTYWMIGSTMYRYTLYKSVPHYLKRPLWMSLRNYSSYKSNDTFNPDDVYRFFADYDSAGGFTYSGKYDQAVRIYNIKGADKPYRLTSTGEKNTDGTSLEEQVEGDFCYILKMIDDLKENGDYKNARIIITADCGDTDFNQHAMLLYKEKGETSEYRVSHADVSLLDLPATLAATVTDDYDDIGTGMTFKDVEELTSPRERNFYRNTGINAESRIEEYKTVTSSIDSKDLEMVDTFYLNGGVITDYQLGSELTFTEDESAVMYCKEGFGHTNGRRTIINRKTAVMEIPLADNYDNIQDLHAYFEVLSVYEDTRCVITSNGTEIFNGEIGNGTRINGLNFLIPTDSIGRDRTIKLVFSFPDLEEDTNVMALTAFKIYKQ